jgi:hypothetical protein
VRASALEDEASPDDREAAKAATPTDHFGLRKTHVFRYRSPLFICGNSRTFAAIRVEILSTLDPHPASHAPVTTTIPEGFASFAVHLPHNKAGVRASALEAEASPGNREAAEAPPLQPIASASERLTSFATVHPSSFAGIRVNLCNGSGPQSGADIPVCANPGRPNRANRPRRMSAPPDCRFATLLSSSIEIVSAGKQNGPRRSEVHINKNQGRTKPSPTHSKTTAQKVAVAPIWKRPDSSAITFSVKTG